MTELLVHACGPMTSLQDRGRFGFQNSGVSPSGAMDGRSLALANALVGNNPGEAAIEFMNLGGSLTCLGGEVRLALAGHASLIIDDHPVPARTTALLREGEILQVGHARGGAFSYLAVAGGFAVPAQLGSLSLHLRSKLGGLDGKPLGPGDRLRSGALPKARSSITRTGCPRRRGRFASCSDRRTITSRATACGRSSRRNFA